MEDEAACLAMCQSIPACSLYRYMTQPGGAGHGCKTYVSSKVDGEVILTIILVIIMFPFQHMNTSR